MKSVLKKIWMIAALFLFLSCSSGNTANERHAGNEKQQSESPAGKDGMKPVSGDSPPSRPRGTQNVYFDSYEEFLKLKPEHDAE